MARIENEWPPLATAVRCAVHAEFNYFTKQVRGFLQSEISRDAPDYFLSLARRLGGYLKAVEGIGCALAWRNEIDDYFYDYFAFADSVDKALHRLQRHQERQEQGSRMRSSSSWAGAPRSTTTRARPTRTTSRARCLLPKRAVARATHGTGGFAALTA